MYIIEGQQRRNLYPTACLLDIGKGDEDLTDSSSR